MTTRPLHAIAGEIQSDWTKPYFGAVPYLVAMRALDSISDKYYYDDAESVVRYFWPMPANGVATKPARSRQN